MAAVHRISIISGTRPEILKLAPVYAALAKRPEIFAPTWIATGQHSSLADQAFADFGVKPDMTVELKDVPAGVSAQVGATVAALAPALATSDPGSCRGPGGCGPRRPRGPCGSRSAVVRF